MKRTALVAACLLALGGCATQRAYEGPERPAGELARIDGSPALNAGLPIAAIIRKVDKTTIGVGYARVLVLPGTHAVLVDCLMKATHVTTRFELQIEVAAGDHYVLVPESAPGNQNCGEVRVVAH